MTPVKVWQERVEIPTYETGPQDIHPMFLENRVYQGSSGAVYPYGVTDTLSEQKTLKSWQAVWLENDYIKVMILPELGGRVHRAWDKVKQRDFVYHNEVIKPALVDAPRDKCTLSCAINGIHAAFHYLKKNYISGCVMTVPTG